MLTRGDCQALLQLKAMIQPRSVLASKLLLIKFMMLIMMVLITACSENHNKTLQLGEKIYQQNCKVCHAQGINGAPIYGNQRMWAKRAAQGIDQLVIHAENGYQLMPAKGGNSTLSETEVYSAVSYMLAGLK